MTYTITAREITDDLIGATIEWEEGGVTRRVHGIAEITTSFVPGMMNIVSREGGHSPIPIFTGISVTVITPPPVKVIQPEEPTALGTLVKIEGEEGWVAVRANSDGVYAFEVFKDGRSDGRQSWEGILLTAAGRQIVVSSAPEFPEAEPPETITEWPEDDDTALRGWAWKDREDDRWEYREGRWSFLRNDSMWSQSNWSHPSRYLPLTRVERA